MCRPQRRGDLKRRNAHNVSYATFPQPRMGNKIRHFLLTVLTWLTVSQPKPQELGPTNQADLEKPNSLGNFLCSSSSENCRHVPTGNFFIDPIPDLEDDVTQIITVYLRIEPQPLEQHKCVRCRGHNFRRLTIENNWYKEQADEPLAVCLSCGRLSITKPV